MKMLLFTLEYPPFKGGVANYYGNMIKYWPADGDDIFVLHNNKGDLIKNRIYPKWLPAVWQLWRAVKNNKINHILVGHILPLGAAAYLVTKITKTPYSIFLHGMDFTFALRNMRKKRITKRILTNAENIICGNSYTAKLVCDFLNDDVCVSFPRKRESRESTKNPWIPACAGMTDSRGNKPNISVVNPGIDGHETQNTEHRTRIKNKYNLDGKIILLTVGRLVKRKGFDKVIEAMPKILKEISNLVYVIVGSGSEVSSFPGRARESGAGKFQVSSLGLEKNVIIITNADDDERNAWYNLCDIFIMPSRIIGDDFEGFGIVYLEANLAGKPVIAGDSGGTRDAVVNGVNGLLVNPENTDEIADAVIKLAKDENLRKKLGEQGRERAINEFNWEKQAQIIYQLMMLDK